MDWSLQSHMGLFNTKYFMRFVEFSENYVHNTDMGFGSERPADQRVMERPRKPRSKAERKLKDHIGFSVGGANPTMAPWANTGAKFKQM